ncbi:MAG TPA: DNA-formamidopyrimidine glycosylase family protein [Candidatus Sulfotelmatobacter sp.]|nr:DNA-formamidopyrimidine glycosylase family protein [Candidatus Sulfotelmatobacter sp.]
MPEGDTIFRAARTLHRALAGHTITHFESVFPRLSRVDTDQGIVGRAVERVEANGKWLLIYFSGGLVLLTHMLMNGSWHIYRPGEKWRLPHQYMRVTLATEQFVAVAFNIQIAEFHTEDSLRRRRGFAALGPSLLDQNFDEAEGLRRLQANPQLEVGDALLKQSVVAGVGNVFKSEVCFATRVNPFRKIASLSAEEAKTLISVARKFLAANVTDTTADQIVTYSGFRRTTARANPEERLWVYGRSGEPCRRCGTIIESRKQGPDARITFWCPQCQPSQSPHNL